MTPEEEARLHGTNDAVEWAKAFCETYAELNDGNTIDLGWMISWFANAMMAERDNGPKAEVVPRDLSDMLESQRLLQVESYGENHAHNRREYGDPRLLDGEALADFITWNCMALVREVGEALEEHRWKPWLTDGSRGGWYDRDAFVKELVDAWHFFMNLLLAAGGPYESPDGTQGRPELTSEEIASEFFSRYYVKRAINAKRQIDGYDGVKDNGSGSGRETDTAELPPTVLGTCEPVDPKYDIGRPFLHPANLDKPLEVPRGPIRYATGEVTSEPSRSKPVWHVSNESQVPGMKTAAERAWQATGERQTLLHAYNDPPTIELVPNVGNYTEESTGDDGDA